MDNIIEIIKKDIKKKQDKYVARSYYKYKPKKESKEINTYSNGQIHTINTNSNTFLYTNYFKMLVKQKINYLLAKEPEIKINSEVLTVTKITDMLEEALLNASLDITAWLHFYVEKGKLDWIFIPDKEIIPIYDKYNKNIIGVIRYFLEDIDTFIVQTWSLKGVKIEKINKDKIVDSQTSYHYIEQTEYQGEIENIEGKNLPFIPFIPLHNNKDKCSDLEGIKDLIDMYNSINSGFVDNIDLFQEAIMKLKGFTGDTEQLKIIQQNMKKYKMVGIPQGGGDNADMEYMAVEIPVEARKTIIEILKENIFKIGQGLDPDRILSGGTNITNVMIKSHYSALDMKANGSEKQAKLFYESVIDCLDSFYNTSIDKEITFNRSMIFNESEQIDNCLKSLNILDQESILENHPWVNNVKMVVGKLNAEKEQAIKEQQEIMKNADNAANNMNTDDLKNK